MSLRYNPVLYDFYLKKINEGKSHRVALSHVCKKIVRIIYTLETKKINFDPSFMKKLSQTTFSKFHLVKSFWHGIFPDYFYYKF